MIVYGLIACVGLFVAWCSLQLALFDPIEHEKQIKNKIQKTIDKQKAI